MKKKFFLVVYLVSLFFLLSILFVNRHSFVLLLLLIAFGTWGFIYLLKRK